MNINPTKNLSPKFGAIKVATAKSAINGCSSSIEIYELFRRDLAALEQLAARTNYDKLAPKLPQKLRKRWQHILNYCITRAFKEDRCTFAAVNQNKICGIMTVFKNSQDSVDLEGICSIPKKNGQRVPLVGKSLFYYLFKTANNSDISKITLKAVKDGPFELVSKYESLGFKEERSKDDEYVEMHCNKHKIAEQLRELPFLINLNLQRDNKHTNLGQFIG